MQVFRRVVRPDFSRAASTGRFDLPQPFSGSPMIFSAKIVHDELVLRISMNAKPEKSSSVKALVVASNTSLRCQTLQARARVPMPVNVIELRFSCHRLDLPVQKVTNTTNQQNRILLMLVRLTHRRPPPGCEVLHATVRQGTRQGIWVRSNDPIENCSCHDQHPSRPLPPLQRQRLHRPRHRPPQRDAGRARRLPRGVWRPRPLGAACDNVCRNCACRRPERAEVSPGGTERVGSRLAGFEPDLDEAAERHTRDGCCNGPVVSARTAI